MKSGLHISRIPGFFFIFLLVFLFGCGQRPLDVDTPTMGTIKVGVDDSYKLLLDAEVYTFQAQYKYAKLDTMLGNEADIIDLFMKDSLPLIVTNRKLTQDEEKFLTERQIIPKTTQIAFDAVAFIVNNDNIDSNLLYDKIREIFEGKVTTWKQLNAKKSTTDSIKVVFDNYKSSNPRYFKEKFNLSKLPSTCFAVNNNEEVINFVEKNKNAIGIISVNWISDKQDTVSHGFLNRVKVVKVSAPGVTDAQTAFFPPHPGYIAQGDYPFTREVYCINRQTYSGLAYGFSAFIAGEKGQLIVLHSGLVPAAQPVRLVEIKN